MMRSLLQKIDFQWDIFERKHSCMQSIQSCAYPFQLDQSTGLLHKKECNQLPGDGRVIGSTGIAFGFKRHASPCPACCQQRWKEGLLARNKDVINHSHCNYFYLPTGRTFHRPDYRIVLHFQSQPKGILYYETYEAKGKVPCKICRSEPVKLSTYEQLVIKAQPQAEQQTPPAQNTLTAAEMQAVKRHQQASRERSRLDTVHMTKQQRLDSLTLTATRFAFWTVPGYRTFHTRNCIKLKGMENIQGFARFTDAVHAGFSPCR